MYGLVTLSLVPVRTSHEESSEMSTQLLFGEYVEILESSEKWLFVRNITDNYKGWVDRKMIFPLSDNDYRKHQTYTPTRMHRPYTIIYNVHSNETKLLPGGSIVHGLEAENFMVGNEKWCLIEPHTPLEVPLPAHKLMHLALSYLNAPYLWGGKSVLGIDCSGLVQVVFAMGGYALPRDASQQVEMGKRVDFITEALPGDLAFFENAEGRIIHVGILVDSANILHASGWVRIDSIDAQGIRSSVSKEYSHKLRIIKRIIPEK